MNGSRRHFIKGSSLAAIGAGLAPGREAAAADEGRRAERSRALRRHRLQGHGLVRHALGPEDGGRRVRGARRRRPGGPRRAARRTRQRRAARRPSSTATTGSSSTTRTIDAVIVGTPDHWHCLILVDALAAGKHVYVEKPVANSIEEARVMLAAARRSGRIVQVGQWQRSGPQYQQALEMVRSGALGKIRLVKVWAYQGWMKPVPVQPDSAPPAGVDYDMWLGPAPKRPFNPNRFHFNFRWFWDYAGGLMTDWGVHEIDIALWVMDAKAPKSVMASGGKVGYPDDASETPDTLQAVFEYDGFNMLWEHATGIDGGNYGRTEGIAFIGNNGTLVVNRGGWELLPETTEVDGQRRYRMEALPPGGPATSRRSTCTRANFVEAIRKSDASILTCGLESGSVAAINAHMGNIAFKVGRKVYWDPATGSFKGDAEANALLVPRYHNGWKLPTSEG